MLSVFVKGRRELEFGEFDVHALDLLIRVVISWFLFVRLLLASLFGGCFVIVLVLGLDFVFELGCFVWRSVWF